MSANLVAVSYLAAIILFILSLGGLSNPESSRRGNLYGMIGMAIAVLATGFGPHVTPAGLPWVAGALVAGAPSGLHSPPTGKVAEMPAPVTVFHRPRGPSALRVGYGSCTDRPAPGRCATAASRPS